MNYEAIIHTLVDSIVEHPESLLIRVINEDEHNIVVYVASETDDTARLIGRKGTIANALREVVSVAGKSENKRVHLKFESFDTEKEEE